MVSHIKISKGIQQIITAGKIIAFERSEIKGASWEWIYINKFDKIKQVYFESMSRFATHKL